MKILAVGDMHLGRTPSRLPPDLPADQVNPAAAWRRTVDFAVDRGVASVLLAGDVVDHDDDFFEAYRELERGIRMLADASIGVIGVAGNHDLKVLPRLAGNLDQFRLLGGEGAWESVSVSDGADEVTVWGWSFPSSGTAPNPLAGWSFPLPPGVNLGLLHCDRDGGADSRYAPVTSQELERAGLDGWLLGHIHKPDPLSAAAPSGYLGSLTGLDRSETGPHGPWMITVADGRIVAVEQCLLAPLRWETLSVELTGIKDAAESRDRLLAAAKLLDRELAADSADPVAVGLCVTLTGRTRFGNAALDELSAQDGCEVLTGAFGARYFIRQLSVDTRPDIELNVLAGRPDPVGLLAARLLWLDRPVGDADRERLLNAAREQLRVQAASSLWQHLEASGEPDPEEWIRQAGMRALDHLLTQLADDGTTG